jgi:hypothetical protein
MMNATRSEKQTPRLVNSNCPIIWDPCSGEVLAALPGTKFKYVCKIEDFRKDYLKSLFGSVDVVKVSDAARLIHCSTKTLYNWIESEKLRAEHGLRPLGKRWRIDLTVFLPAFDRGELGRCS